MREELGDSHLPERGAGDVLRDGVVQIDERFVAHPQHLDCHEGLGNRPEAVLRLDCRQGTPAASVERAHRVEPDQISATHEPGGQGGQSTLRLLYRQAL